MWLRERNHTDADTGELHRTRMLNTHRGLLLTLHDGGGLQAERSLPKALTGQNIVDLCQGDVPRALAVVDEEIEDALGSGLPPFGDWLPVRVDYCRSVEMGDEAKVLRTLDKMAGIELPYKGLPVRGQAHSVAWPKGSIRPKVYSKYLESRDPAAWGVLRFESGVLRARSFRRLVGLLPEREDTAARGSADADFATPGPAPGDGLRVLDVLTPELHEAVLGRFANRLRGDLMTGKEIGDVDLLREMVRFFGARRAATLLGWATLFVAMGAKTRQDWIAIDLGSWRTRYRVVADIRSFREHLREEGWETTPDDEGEDEAVEQLVARLAELKAA